MSIGPAHEKVIVHRDLKPANVKVTPEGKVKFGYIESFTSTDMLSRVQRAPAPVTSGRVVAGNVLGLGIQVSQ